MIPLLLTVALAQEPQIVGLHYRVMRVDIVEREFRAAGQSRPVVGVFSTRYKVGGKVVKPSVFWNTLKPGMELDAKVRQHPLFSIAVAADININIKR